MINIHSFGYLHNGPPTADLTVDLRSHFRDPHINPELRGLTAKDQPVREAVVATPGIPRLVTFLAEVARAMQAGPGGGQVTVAIGCAGGRHRAPVVADLLAEDLGASVRHRDLDKPVVQR